MNIATGVTPWSKQAESFGLAMVNVDIHEGTCHKSEPKQIAVVLTVHQKII